MKIEDGNESDSKIGRVRKEHYKDHEILVVDFSDGKEAGMINTGTESRDLIIRRTRKFYY